MLYSKIKIEIDTNNDELLETIWEHLKGRNKKVKRRGDIIKLKKLPSIFPLSLFWPLFSHFQSET
jgi:hypothetical protein